MNPKRCDELYASYMAGHALGKEHGRRSAPGVDASLDAWAQELGYLDGASAAPLRAATDLVRWCVCYRAYQRCAAGLAATAPGEADECGPDAASTIELGCRLGASDARAGQCRSPLAIAQLLRSFGG